MTASIIARSLLGLALALITVPPCPAEAQQPVRVPRIGYLLVSPLALTPTAERAAFLQGLQELGYVEGRNIIIDYRAANWNRELLPELAAELVDLKVDLIVAVGNAAVEAARQATKRIPIVATAVGDPVDVGFVASLGRPGGNITGTGWTSKEAAGKRLQLLKEAVAKVSRVAVIWNPTNVGAAAEFTEIQAAARSLRLTLQPFEVKDPSDFPGVFSAMARERPDALVISLSPLTTAYRPLILEFATKNRLPSMFSSRAEVEAGGLMAYAPSLLDAFRRAAGYVDKVLRGANPGDLPIENPARFDLIINLQTAKALRLTLPQSLLLRATEIIQ